MTTEEFWISFGAMVTIALLLIGGVAAFGHHIAYWLAFLISAVFVYGGFLIFDGDWID